MNHKGRKETTMKYLTFIVAGFICMGSVCYAQDEAAEQKDVATKYEKFTSADGAIYITKFYEVTPPLAKFGKLEAEVLHSTNVSTDSSMTALRFRFKGTDRYAVERTSILDVDEVESLAKAVEYIQKNEKRLIKEAKSYTEITYKSRGGFEAGFYVSPKKNDVGHYIRVGYDYVFLDNLNALADSIKTATEKIKDSEKNR